MTIYTIKSIVTYEIEASNDHEALEIYESGSWDYNEMVDETGIELGIIKPNGDYHTIKE